MRSPHLRPRLFPSTFHKCPGCPPLVYFTPFSHLFDVFDSHIPTFPSHLTPSAPSPLSLTPQRLQLTAFDPDDSGVLPVYALEDYLRSLVMELPPLESIEVCVCVCMCVCMCVCLCVCVCMVVCLCVCVLVLACWMCVVGKGAVGAGWCGGRRTVGGFVWG